MICLQSHQSLVSVQHLAHEDVRFTISNEVSVGALDIEKVIEQHPKQLWFPSIIARITDCYFYAVVRSSEVKALLKGQLVLVHI